MSKGIVYSPRVCESCTSNTLISPRVSEIGKVDYDLYWEQGLFQNMMTIYTVVL